MIVFIKKAYMGNPQKFLKKNLEFGEFRIYPHPPCLPRKFQCGKL